MCSGFHYGIRPNDKSNARLGERIRKSSRPGGHFIPQECEARRKFFIGLTHAAAAGGGKGNNRFTFQIVAFQKCIDDGGSNIPPDRETDKDGVILVHVIAFGGDGRARVRIAHFDGAAGFLVHPV